MELFRCLETCSVIYIIDIHWILQITIPIFQLQSECGMLDCMFDLPVSLVCTSALRTFHFLLNRVGKLVHVDFGDCSHGYSTNLC